MSSKMITTFTPKGEFPTTWDIKESIAKYLGGEWTMQQGICPKVSENVDTAVIVAELLNIHLLEQKNGSLEGFRDGINQEKIDEVKKEIFFSLLA